MTTKIDTLMTESGVKFGTSGARGLAINMTDRVCYAYTRGFLGFLREKNCDCKSVAVGGDLRPSTSRIVRAVCRAIIDSGFTAIDCGLLPTPSLAVYALQRSIPAVMVTGSHIPDDRNGIKFYKPDGEILKEDELPIRNQTVTIPEELFDIDGMLTDITVPVTNDAATARASTIVRFRNALPTAPLAGLRIGFYEHSAVGRDLIVDLLTELGAIVTQLGRSEVFVPVDTEAVRTEDLELAKKWAVMNNFDAIFSTDGDSDRPLIFDERGNWIRGDIAGILCAKFLRADCVVTPVSSNTALERSNWFEQNAVVRTKIGSPYVVEAMNKAVAKGAKQVVGYEANGGFLTATAISLTGNQNTTPLSPLPTREPVIVLLALLLLAKERGMKLSTLCDELPKRTVVAGLLTNFPMEVAAKKMNELINSDHAALAEMFKIFGTLQTVDKTDGIRLTFQNKTSDVIHLRPSGNAPEFRCYVETESQTQANELLEKAMEFVKKW